MHEVLGQMLRVHFGTVAAEMDLGSSINALISARQLLTFTDRPNDRNGTITISFHAAAADSSQNRCSAGPDARWAGRYRLCEACRRDAEEGRRPLHTIKASLNNVWTMIVSLGSALQVELPQSLM